MSTKDITSPAATTVTGRKIPAIEPRHQSGQYWQMRGQKFGEAFIVLPAGLIPQDLTDYPVEVWSKIQQTGLSQMALRQYDRVLCEAADRTWAVEARVKDADGARGARQTFHHGLACPGGALHQVDPRSESRPDEDHGVMVERTDWTFEKPVSRHEQPLPGSAVVVVPAARDLTPGEMIQQYEAEGVHGFESEAPAGDPLEGMTEDQLETVQVAIGMILGEDPTGFAEAFDRLSPGLQGKVFTTLSANPHLRGLDLIDAIERKLTLAEAAEAEAFLRGLSPEHRRLLRG